MMLITNWKLITKFAWSMRLAVISGVLSGVEVILPLFMDSFPRGVFAVLSLVAAISSAVSRIVAQPNMWLKGEESNNDEP